MHEGDGVHARALQLGPVTDTILVVQRNGHDNRTYSDARVIIVHIVMFLFLSRFFHINSKINKSLLKYFIDKTSHNKINNIYIKILSKTSGQTKSES